MRYGDRQSPATHRPVGGGLSFTTHPTGGAAALHRPAAGWGTFDRFDIAGLDLGNRLPV